MIRAPRRRPEQTEDPSVQDMTPMIDVVFQLLIFFMLTMQFKEVEGKLLSQLPRSHGPAPAPSIETLELRVAIRPAGGAECAVAVEGHGLGRLTSTETLPSASTSNKAVYRAVGEKVRALAEGSGARRAVIDASPEVPYEHVLGVVDGLKQAGVEGIEFAANPRFEKYYR